MGGRIARRIALRIALATSTVATLLAPALVSPVRAIPFPEVLAHSVTGHGSRRVVPIFPVTHIAFSWRGPARSGVVYRTADPDGDGTGWKRVPEAHDLEDGASHYGAVLSVDDPAVLEWRPVRGAGPVTLDYLNTIDGPRRWASVPAAAAAAASTPEVVTRAEWGADESLKSTGGSCTRTFHPLQQLFVHHTGGTNYDSHPEATMRAILWFHTVRRGWCDIGYNFVIGWDGRVFEGRWARRYDGWETHTSEDRKGRVVAGAHTSGYNSGSAGISLMGNFSTVTPPPAPRRALVELLAWEVDRHGLKARGRHVYTNPQTGLARELPYIAGHRQAGSTDCPGDYLFGSLPAIRRDVRKVIGDGKDATTLRLFPAPRLSDQQHVVGFGGRLADERGRGLEARTVRIYRRNGTGKWRFGFTVTTAADGRFSFALGVKRRVRVRAVYEGDADTWGSQSGVAGAHVRPLAEL